MIFYPYKNSIEILQALYWLVIGSGGGLVETNYGWDWGREIVFTRASEFTEETEAAVQLPLAEDGPFCAICSTEPSS